MKLSASFARPLYENGLSPGRRMADVVRPGRRVVIPPDFEILYVSKVPSEMIN